jgi:hypothetical protein
MAQAKLASKRRRRKIALPAWGAAGMSLAMAGGASAAVAPTADTGPHRAAPAPAVTLGEEEISDVSLSTFYLFDKEAAGKSLGTRVAAGCRCGGGGCGGCRGAGGGCRCAAGGCRCGGGCRGCGCRCAGGCGCACVVVGCGGCSCGCCLSWGACQLC